MERPVGVKGDLEGDVLVTGQDLKKYDLIRVRPTMYIYEVIEVLEEGHSYKVRSLIDFIGRVHSLEGISKVVSVWTTRIAPEILYVYLPEIHLRGRITERLCTCTYICIEKEENCKECNRRIRCGH